MKVMYVVSTLQRTGPTRQLLNIVSNLPDDIEPVIVTLSPEPADSLWSLFEQANIPMRSLELGRVAGAFFAGKRLRRLLEEERPDVLHGQGVRADGLLAKMKHYKCVSTLRNIPTEEYPMNWGAFMGGIVANKHLRALAALDVPVCVSHAVANALKHRLKLRVVPNGVDTSYFTPASGKEAKEQIRKGLGWRDDTTYLVSAGLLNSRKNPLALVNAVQRLTDDYVRLVLLGEGPLKAGIVGSGDRVMMMGNVDDVRPYLQASDAYLSASLAEGYPNGVLEAQACGLPCLLSEIGPHKELAMQSPDTIKLFSLDDENALNETLQVFLNQDLASLSKQSRTFAESELSAKAMAERYVEIYRGLNDQ